MKKKKKTVPLYDIDAGKYIKRVRELEGLSRPELAKLAGISNGLAEHENDRRKMSFNSFLAICRVAGITDFNEILREEVAINNQTPIKEIIQAYKEEKKQNPPSIFNQKRNSKIRVDLDDIVAAIKRAQENETPINELGLGVNNDGEIMNFEKTNKEK